MFTIKVISESTGKPLNHKRVRIGFEGFTRGMSGDVYSDSNGEAHFDYKPDRGTVYVDGKSVHVGKLEGRIVVYI